MVRVVAQVYHWTPEYIKNLYLDDMDFFGLEFWFDAAISTVKNLKE